MITALVALIPFTGAACGKDDKADITVAQKEYSLTPSATSFEAGKVRVEVDNEGSIPHEFVVFKTDLPEGDLPLNADGNEVDEEGKGITHMEPEAEDVQPGKHKTITLDLPAGSYVMLCNVTDHYNKGMHVSFTTT